jgi:hypothetical protein
MSIEIAHETEARLMDEARRQGISVDALLERLIDEGEATALAASAEALPQLPILHLGAMGAFHRRDIYDDGR